MFRYEKTKEDYILYFPELINLHIPFEYHICTSSFGVIRITDEIMENMVNGLNNGDISIFIDDASVCDNGIKIDMTLDNIKKLVRFHKKEQKHIGFSIKNEV